MDPAERGQTFFEVQEVEGVREFGVINLDCDLEDCALVYDYNKGEYINQLLPSDTPG